MSNESIVELVKDLTTQLSAIAMEFGVRADQVALVSPNRQPGERSAGDFASRLLDQRTARFRYFSHDLFHEPAWDMLLALFVAHEERRSLNIKALVSFTHAPVTTSQRWIEHLHKLNLINRVVDPLDRRRVDISLTDSGEQAIRGYLDHLAA